MLPWRCHLWQLTPDIIRHHYSFPYLHTGCDVMSWVDFKGCKGESINNSNGCVLRDRPHSVRDGLRLWLPRLLVPVGGELTSSEHDDHSHELFCQS